MRESRAASVRISVQEWPLHRWGEQWFSSPIGVGAPRRSTSQPFRRSASFLRSARLGRKSRLRAAANFARWSAGYFAIPCGRRKDLDLLNRFAFAATQYIELAKNVHVCFESKSW